MSSDLGSPASAIPPPLTPRPPQRRQFAEAAKSTTSHATEATRTYPCASCGGQCVFDIAGQKLRCPSCGNYRQITASDTPIRPHELEPAMQQLRIMQHRVDSPDVTGMLTVTCQNCGGSIDFIGSLTATRCPYCATPIQRSDVHQAPARLAVDGVLPFTVNEKAANLLVEKWIAKRWFAPSDFTRMRRISSFASVYTAYFTYDANTGTAYTGERGTLVRVRSGTDSNGHPTYRTEIRWRFVSGQVYNDFTDKLAMANDIETLNPGLTAKLEPWPVNQARSYTPEFIAGHLCRTYDKDAEQAFPPVRKQMEKEIEQTVIANIGGDSQRVHRMDTDWKYLGFKHLLLPIWLLTVTYRGRSFQVYLNGVTGKVVGGRPYSPWKILFAVLATILAIAGVIMWVTDQGEQPSSSTPTSSIHSHYPSRPSTPAYPQQPLYPAPSTYLPPIGIAPPTDTAPPIYPGAPVDTAPPINPENGLPPTQPEIPNYPDSIGN